MLPLVDRTWKVRWARIEAWVVAPVEYGGRLGSDDRRARKFGKRGKRRDRRCPTPVRTSGIEASNLASEASYSSREATGPGHRSFDACERRFEGRASKVRLSLLEPSNPGTEASKVDPRGLDPQPSKRCPSRTGTFILDQGKYQVRSSKVSSARGAREGLRFRTIHPVPVPVPVPDQGPPSPLRTFRARSGHGHGHGGYQPPTLCVLCALCVLCVSLSLERRSSRAEGQTLPKMREVLRPPNAKLLVMAIEMRSSRGAPQM